MAMLYAKWNETLVNLKFSQLATWIAQVVLLVTLICIFVPFSPVMPTAGFDPSWVFAMNQVVVQGLSFGKDIIFTFGPYSSIYTHIYHPTTDSLMLIGSGYLAISYWKLKNVYESGGSPKLHN